MGLHCFLGQIISENKENNGIVKVPLASVWKNDSWSLLFKFQDIFFFILFAAAVNERLKKLPIVIPYSGEQSERELFRPSQKQVLVMMTPYSSKTGVYRVRHYFALKHRLWVLVRTVSMRRF